MVLEGIFLGCWGFVFCTLRFDVDVCGAMINISLRAKEVSCQQRHENMQRRSINTNELNMNLQSRFVIDVLMMSFRFLTAMRCIDIDMT